MDGDDVARAVAEEAEKKQKVKVEPMNEHAAALALKLKDPDYRDLCGEELGPLLVVGFDAIQHILDVPDDDIRDTIKEWIFDPVEPLNYQQILDTLEDIHSNNEANFDKNLEKFEVWYERAKMSGLITIALEGAGPLKEFAQENVRVTPCRHRILALAAAAAAAAAFVTTAVDALHCVTR